jgi:hypothetical protein
MLDQQKNDLAYKGEKASSGELVVSQEQRAVARSTRTTVRVQPTRAQVWQAIQLVRFLGGKPEGRTVQWAFQVLFDSLIAQHIKNGDIKPISNEEADLALREFKAENLPKGTAIETLEQIREIEEQTSTAGRAHQEFGEDLEKAAQEQDLEGIGDLFDFSEFSE